MKSTASLFILVLFFASSCVDTPVASPDTPEEVQPMPLTAVSDTPTSAPEDAPMLELLKPSKGYFVGKFQASKTNDEDYDYHSPTFNKINLSIDSIFGDSIIGHSVVAGNDRPFVGVLDSKTGKYTATEPGDDRYDGVFYFRFIGKNQIRGSWVANNKKLTVYERTYQLERKTFAYDKALDLPQNIVTVELYIAKKLRKEIFKEKVYTQEELDNGAGSAEQWEGEFLTEDVLVANPSTTLLTKEMLQNMYKGDLEVLRNSIYARHGYSFANRSMRYIFDNVDWYIPVHAEVKQDLTELEKKNIALIKRYEGHSERYYDVFGR
jgi:hypothetical protein